MPLPLVAVGAFISGIGQTFTQVAGFFKGKTQHVSMDGAWPVAARWADGYTPIVKTYYPASAVDSDIAELYRQKLVAYINGIFARGSTWDTETGRQILSYLSNPDFLSRPEPFRDVTFYNALFIMTAVPADSPQVFRAEMDNSLGSSLLPALKELGFDHTKLLSSSGSALDKSQGQPGSSKWFPSDLFPSIGMAAFVLVVFVILIIFVARKK